MKTQLIVKEIFASYPSDKGLISRICKELKNLNTKRINNAINKWGSELNRQFSKELQVANEYMKRMYLATREMQIKTMLRSISPQTEYYHQKNK
jgi:hypothetical protein